MSIEIDFLLNSWGGGGEFHTFPGSTATCSFPMFVFGADQTNQLREQLTVHLLRATPRQSFDVTVSCTPPSTLLPQFSSLKNPSGNFI